MSGKDLVKHMGGLDSPSTSTTSSSGGPLGGSSVVCCQNKEADDDTIDQRPEDDVTVKQEFLQDPMDENTQVQDSAQVLDSPVLLLRSDVAPPHLPQHHETPIPTTGSSATIPDLVDCIGSMVTPSTSTTSGTCGSLGGGGGVHCKSEEALGAAWSSLGGENDVDQRLEDAIKIEPEFLHDPLDVTLQVQGSTQAMASPVLLSPSTTALPHLPQHHRTLLPMTGSAAAVDCIGVTSKSRKKDEEKSVKLTKGNEISKNELKRKREETSKKNYELKIKHEDFFKNYELKRKREEISKKNYELKRKREFLPKWLEDYKWLRYDEEAAAMFCKHCEKYGDNKSSSFVTGCSKFRVDSLKCHEASSCHASARTIEKIDMKKKEQKIVLHSYTGDTENQSASETIKGIPEYSEENKVQHESISARSTISPPPQPQEQTGSYLLKKETHCSTVLDQLLRDETFTDVTLTAEGQSIRGHRVVLCLASAYFRQVLSHDQNIHSVVILRDIKFTELKNIINFIYTGEATVDVVELGSFMRTADILEITSLCEAKKSISIGGHISQSNGSGFNIEEYECSLGTKRNHKDASPTPSKNRKVFDEQSSCSSTHGLSATSVTCIREEPIDHDNRMHRDEPVYRGSDGHSKVILEDSPRFGSKNLSTASDTGEIEAIEGGPNSGGDGKSDTSGRTSPSAMVPDITTLPGQCPYCPHLNQEFRGISMMRHLLVSHACKPAYPCDNCFRVFVRKSQFRFHQAKCNDL